MMESQGTMKKYIVIGAGAYLNDIFDIIHANDGRVVKIFQNVPEEQRDRVPPVAERIAKLEYAVEVHDTLDVFKPEDGFEYVLGCITPRKHALVSVLKKKYKITISSLVHPDSTLGSNIFLGEGVLIAPGVVIAPNARLDDYCVINRSVSIGHEAYIGSHARIGPSAALAALTKVGAGSSIGIGATVLDRIYIGEGSVIGAGAVVTKDIPDQVVAYGVPAKIIRESRE